MMVASYRVNSRILVMGLGDPSLGDEGIGVYLARSLRGALEDVDVEEIPPGGPDYLTIFHEFDVVIFIDSIAMCSNIGRVTLVSPYALPDLKGAWVEHAQNLVNAIEESRLLGRRIPKIHIVAVCVPDVDTPARQLSPGMAALYLAVLTRVRDSINRLIREASDSSLMMPTRGA